MPCASYIANGYCREATADDARRGMSELRFWNPTQWDSEVKMRVYYSDAPPGDIPPFTIEAGGNPLLVFPRDHTELFKDVGPWGMRIISDTPLMLDHICSCGRKGPDDNVQFAGGVNDSLAKTRLSRLWYFGDGLALIWEPDKAPFPFNEFEWYHILNPNPTDAHVTMQCCYERGDEEKYSYTVAAERVLLIDNYQMVRTNNAFGIRFISDVPIVVESERFIYGLHGMEEWGAHVHCPRPGVPAPLEWNEQEAVE